MGKITVKHYLNTNLKPYIIGDEKYYKLYYLLRYQNKNTKIKSLVDIEITQLEFDEIISNDSNILNQRIKTEVKLIENIIRIMEKSNVIFEIKVFNDFLHLATFPIIEKLEEFIKFRFKGYIDSYEELNFVVFNDILKELKAFVVNNHLCIKDEIYLMQMYDNEMNKAINLQLKERKKISIWEVKNKKDHLFRLGDFIKIEYEQIQYNTIEFIIETLTESYVFSNYYEQENIITGNIGDFHKYVRNICSLFSVR